jgi:hypothetical protein
MVDATSFAHRTPDERPQNSNKSDSQEADENGEGVIKRLGWRRRVLWGRWPVGEAKEVTDQDPDANPDA